MGDVPEAIRWCQNGGHAAHFSEFARHATDYGDRTVERRPLNMARTVNQASETTSGKRHDANDGNKHDECRYARAVDHPRFFTFRQIFSLSKRFQYK
jgi:hypothetical protein